MKRLLAFGFLLLASAATSKAEGSYCGEIIDHGEPSGYRVVGFDGATNTWTIIRNGTFNGKYLVVRLTVACQAHKYADGDLLRGRDQCVLQVGRLFHWYKSCDGGDFEMVSESQRGSRCYKLPKDVNLTRKPSYSTFSDTRLSPTARPLIGSRSVRERCTKFLFETRTRLTSVSYSS